MEDGGWDGRRPESRLEDGELAASGYGEESRV
jgi:hypothetical protein